MPSCTTVASLARARSFLDIGGFAVKGIDVVYRLLRKRLRAESDGPLDIEALKDQIGRFFLPH